MSRRNPIAKLSYAEQRRRSNAYGMLRAATAVIDAWGYTDPKLTQQIEQIAEAIYNDGQKS